jgi:hypothetical protein
VATDPYRTQPSNTLASRVAKADRAWGDAGAVSLIVASPPVALVVLCVGARAYGGPAFMSSTLLDAAIGFAALLFLACAIDIARR